MPMTDERARYEALKAEVRKLDDAYYNKDKPLAVNEEYDRKKAELEAIEAAHPDWMDATSPSAKPGGDAVKGRKVRHAVKLLSLKDYFSLPDLVAWHGKAGSPAVSVEEKIDGLTLALTYVNNKLDQGATRGDGSIGEDVTRNVPYIQGVPMELPEWPGVDPENNILRVRVEAYQPVAKFLELNEMQEAAGLEPFANPRACASGGLRADDPETARARGLHAFAFRILSAEGWDAAGVRVTQTGDLDILEKLGFAVVAHKLCVDFTGALDEIESIGERRTSLPYWTDGAVVKTDSIRKQSELGEGSKYPAWAAAYKYPAEERETTVRNVRLQTGRTGAVTPVAEIDPVQIGGTTVSNVTLHNHGFIRDNKLGIGARVVVIKSGEIIPKVEKVLEPAETPFEIKACPSCGGPVKERLDADGNPSGVMVCQNASGCPAQKLRYFEFFCSKDVMDISGMGPAAVKSLVDAGLLENVWDIYDLPYKIPEVAALDGFGRKKAENLAKAVTKSKSNDIDRLVKALGIPGVGRHTGRLLAKKCPDMDAVMRLGVDSLMSMEGIGEVTARDIESAWGNGKRELVARLEAKGVNTKSKEYGCMALRTETVDGPLYKLSIVATGTIEGYTRGDIEDLIRRNGGTPSGSVSKKTACLIVGTNAGSKLEKAADLGIPIYSIGEFKEKYGIR